MVGAPLRTKTTAAPQIMLALVTRPLACTVVTLGAKGIPRLSSAAQLVHAARLRHMQVVRPSSRIIVFRCVVCLVVLA